MQVQQRTPVANIGDKAVIFLKVITKEIGM